MSRYENLSKDLFNLPALAADICVFDVDHTITRRSTGVRMAQVGIQHGFVSRLTFMQFPLYYMRYRIGSYNLGNLPDRLEPLTGLRRSVIDEWGKSTFEEFIKDDIFPEVQALISRIHELGKTLILCTSSVDFVIAPLAKFLKIDHTICTEIHYDGDICTGEIKGLPAFGEAKVQKTRNLLHKLGYAFEHTAFFSDSINDLPLLSEVAYPVPTNPDRLLRKEAKKADWPFIDFR